MELKRRGDSRRVAKEDNLSRRGGTFCRRVEGAIPEDPFNDKLRQADALGIENRSRQGQDAGAVSKHTAGASRAPGMWIAGWVRCIWAWECVRWSRAGASRCTGTPSKRASTFWREACRLEAGGVEREVGPGQFGLIRTGTPHAWSNTGDGSGAVAGDAGSAARLTAGSMDAAAAGSGYVFLRAVRRAEKRPCWALRRSAIAAAGRGVADGGVQPDHRSGDQDVRGPVSFGAIHQSLFLIQYMPGAKIDAHDHTFEESYLIVSGRVQRDGGRRDLRPGSGRRDLDGSGMRAQLRERGRGAGAMDRDAGSAASGQGSFPVRARLGAVALSSNPAAFNPRDFRNALGRFASGVTVITAHHEEQTHGMTANAFVSVSLEPPLVLVSLDNRSSMHRILPQARRVRGERAGRESGGAEQSLRGEARIRSCAPDSPCATACRCWTARSRISSWR